MVNINLNPSICVAIVQYVIVALCVKIAHDTKRSVDWWVAFSWAMTATLWLVQELNNLRMGL